MAEVQIKATHIVKPANKPRTGKMTLTEIDMSFGNAFLPLLYVYRPNKEWDGAAVVETLKESLGKALVHFYPFAGRLRPTGGGRMVVECDEAALGVPLVEAEAAGKVADLGDDLAEAEGKRRLQRLFAVVDYTKPLHELPLLAVQLTHFRCGGVSVGVTVSHAVADGVGIGHFLSEWTRLARGEPLEVASVLDHTLLRAGEPPRSVPWFIKDAAPPPPPMMTLPPAPDSGDKPPPMKMPPIPETTSVKLAVSKSQIDKLKKAAGDVINGRPYTRYEVLAAHAWRCGSKTRGHEDDKPNVLGIGVDIRKRVNPPLPPAYFGNAVVTMPATSESSDDLNSNPLGYACSRIRQAINNVTDEYVWTHLDYLKAQDDLRAWRGLLTPEGQFVNPDFVMVSWLTLSFYGLDFGWGKEAHMASSPLAFEGVGCLLAGQEEGSAIVVMCLQVGHVEKFKKYFYQDLN